MSTVTALIYALLLCLVTAVQLEGFYFLHEECRMEKVRERGREEKKNNTGNVTVMQLASASVDFLLPL